MNTNFIRLAQYLLIVGSILAPTYSAHAEESQFGYVYTTDLLPKGEKEIQQWMTWRKFKAHGYFDQLEGRTAVEYGVTNNFQMAVYANYAAMRAYRDSVDRETVPSETFAELQPDPTRPLHASKYIGTSLEGIYRILSPYKDPFGLAIYIEPTLGNGLQELESKVILQKNFLDDRLITAFNWTVAQEGRWLPGDPDAEPGSRDSVHHWDHETDMNFGFASSYRFIENWSAGLEFLNEREYSCYCIAKNSRTNSAYFLGPTIHYGGKKFAVTVTALSQLTGASDFANPAPGFIQNGRTTADDFELFRLRVKASYNF